MANDIQLNPGGLTPGFGQTGGSTSFPGVLRRTAAGVAAGVGNIAFPGVGTTLGNLILGNGASGNPASSGDPQLDSMQTQMMQDNRNMLVFQYQMNAESRMFESSSNAIKSRHDASMAAIRNIKQ